jgi:hypothetical protein
LQFSFSVIPGRSLASEASKWRRGRESRVDLYLQELYLNIVNLYLPWIPFPRTLKGVLAGDDRKAGLFAWLGSIPLPQKSRAFCMVGFHPFTTKEQSFLQVLDIKVPLP